MVSFTYYLCHTSFKSLSGHENCRVGIDATCVSDEVTSPAVGSSDLDLTSIQSGEKRLFDDEESVEFDRSTKSKFLSTYAQTIKTLLAEIPNSQGLLGVMDSSLGADSILSMNDNYERLAALCSYIYPDETQLTSVQIFEILESRQEEHGQNGRRRAQKRKFKQTSSAPRPTSYHSDEEEF